MKKEENIKPPYFKHVEYLELYPDEKESVLSKVFNQPIRIYGKRVYDINGIEIYYENDNGFWEKTEYDKKGNRIYYEDSESFWYKKEYNTNDKLIYLENSYGEIIDNR